MMLAIEELTFNQTNGGTNEHSFLALAVISLNPIEERGSSAVYAVNLFPCPGPRDQEAAIWVLKVRKEHLEFGVPMSCFAVHLPLDYMRQHLGRRGPIMRAFAYDLPEEKRAIRLDLPKEDRPGNWFVSAIPSLMFDEQYTVDLFGRGWSCPEFCRNLVKDWSTKKARGFNE